MTAPARLSDINMAAAGPGKIADNFNSILAS